MAATTTKRFQLDLSETEHQNIERLIEMTGLKTKRELVSNALSLFQWAATQIQSGRSIGAIDAAGDISRVELLSLNAVARLTTARASLQDRLPSAAELQASPDEPTRPMADMLAEIMAKLEGISDASRNVRKRRTATV